MFPHVPHGCVRPSNFLSLCIVAAIFTRALALDSFRSIDNRLPNPDRSYNMTGSTVHFPSTPHFALYDLVFQPSMPSQLDFPTLNKDGNWEFDSTFDFNYKVVISVSTEPAHTVTGWGTAQAVGVAPGGSFTQVYDTELLSFNLYGLSPIPEIMLRESPTLRSTGVTTRENLCPMCLSPVTYWRISSFFDVFAEVSTNGGSTWTPGASAIHIEQVTSPAMDADFNHDGVVDSADYIAWRKNNGGMYTASDFDPWRANFGQSAASGLSAPGAIPEPATCWLLALAICAILQRRPGFIGIAARL